MKKFSTLICMLLCMYFWSPVLANEISPVKSGKDDAEKKAALLASWYAPGLEVSNLYFEQIDLLFTDNSYADVSYSLSRQVEGSVTWEYLYDFNLPDSGSVLTLTDNVLPGTSYNYSIAVTLEDGTTLSDVAMVSATSPLEPPMIEYDDMYMYDCGSEIPIQVDFIYTGAYTEIYHALSASGPWHLETTLPPGTRNALFDVSPRQTHYFRARGTNAAHDTFSDWSNVISRHVESDWYDPTFTVTVLPDRTVEIKLVMRTFVNAQYGITRMGDDDSFSVVSGLETSDSAAVYTFHDTTVQAGKGYEYILNAYQVPILCVGWPGGGDRDPDIARVYVTIPPDDYTISGFTLVDPATDEDIGPLTNNLQFEANLLPNIRANVGPHVKSVIFFLNNKRRTDNGPPLFTYFPANNITGDYEPGVWLPGNYTLEATAYSEKNGKGIKGTTLEIFFQVLPSVHLDSLVLIDPVTNAPIRRLRNFDTVDASLNANIRAYTSSNAKCVTFFLNNKRRTDNGPPEFTYFALGSGGLSVPGQYLLKSTASTEKNGGGFVGYTFHTNFTVVGPAPTSPMLARAETEETAVALYPNPVASTSRLQVSGAPASKVSVQVYDQFGAPVGRQIDATVDAKGEYQLPLNELQLKKGAYILNVKVDGARMIKRFVVE